MSNPNTDTIAASTATTSSLAVPTSARGGAGRFNGFVNSAADQDWIRLDLIAGELYRFTADDTSGGFTPTLALRSASGASLVEDVNPRGGITFTYRPATSGTFYLDVGGVGSGAGGYAVTAFEVPGAKTTFATLGVGALTTGNIQSAADQDWFKVTLVAGQTYIFDATAGTLVDPTLALRDAAGAQIAFDDDGGPGSSSRIIYTATSSGTFFLDVGGFTSNTGDYTLTSRMDAVPGDVATNAALPFPLNFDDSFSTTLETSGDHDWFSISLTAGRSYIFSSYAFGAVELRFRDAIGTILASDFASDDANFREIYYTASVTTTYYLDVSASGGFVGDVALFVQEDDFGNYEFDTNGFMTVGEVRSGKVDYASDRDQFAITLVGGQDYKFMAIGGVPVFRAVTGRYEGARVTDNGDGQAFATPETGTYYAAVSENTVGAYQVRMIAADVLGSTASLEILSAKYSGEFDTYGILDAADQDFFRVQLTAGKTYLFETGAVSLFDTTMALRNSAGTQIAFDDDAGLGNASRIKFTATSSGTYFLDVGGYGANSGAYGIRFAEDDVADDISTSDSLSVGSTRSAVLNGSGDIDYFRISFAAGQTHEIEMTAGSGGSFYLRDENGNSLLDGQSAGNTLIYTSPTNQQVYISVEYGNGAYQLIA